MVYLMRSEGNAGTGGWTSDWTPSDFDTYDEARLQVFSNCEEVELFLNDKSLGVKPMPDDKASPRTWTTTFQKGTIKAVGRNGGKVVAEQVLKTAGDASTIILTADKPIVNNDWNDVAHGIIISLEQVENYPKQSGREDDPDKEWRNRTRGIAGAEEKVYDEWLPADLMDLAKRSVKR